MTEDWQHLLTVESTHRIPDRGLVVSPSFELTRFKVPLRLELELKPPDGPVRTTRGKLSLVHISAKDGSRWEWVLTLAADEPDIPDGTVIRARLSADSTN
jgi:hypothetical protein